MTERALPTKKLFTAEVQRRRRLGLDEGVPVVPAAASPPPPPPIPVDNSDVLDELRALQKSMAELDQMVRRQYAPDTLPTSEAVEAAAAKVSAERAEIDRQKQEMSILRMELRALANSIQETKREIAQLRSNNQDNDRLIAVAGELDAIVGSTERATDGILDAAERIDNIASELRANGSESYIGRLAEEVSECVMTIYEHCNFQDITGQRTTKVVNTLKFVEERVDKMIEIWGRETFDELLEEDDPIGHHDDDDRRLLNGPQLENMGISQNEIDKLFD